MHYQERQFLFVCDEYKMNQRTKELMAILHYRHIYSNWLTEWRLVFLLMVIINVINGVDASKYV